MTKSLLTALSVIGNQSLDLHRLTQGKWAMHKGHYCEGDLISNQPLHHLLSILYDELAKSDDNQLPLTNALEAFCRSGLNELDLRALCSAKSSFWCGLQCLTEQVAKELGTPLISVSRQQLRDLIFQA